MSLANRHLKYIHIDSSRMDKANDFRVHLPHGFENCTRLCVKSFSIPNTIGNAYKQLGELHFAEFMKPNGESGVGDWVSKHFYVKLDDIPKYTNNTEIVSHINTKIANGEVYDYDTGAQTHTFIGEDPLEIVFAYDENTYQMTYKVSQSTLTDNTNIKVFYPINHNNNPFLWESLGFHHEEFFANSGTLARKHPHRTISKLLGDLNAGIPTIYIQESDVPAGSPNSRISSSGFSNLLVAFKK